MFEKKKGVVVIVLKKQMKLLSGNYPFENKEKIILRDYLAIERTKLANERTFFAYIRTSLYLILAGFAFLQIEGFGSIQWLGYLSLGLSLVILLIGTFRYFRLRKILKTYYTDSPSEENENSAKDFAEPSNPARGR